MNRGQVCQSLGVSREQVRTLHRLGHIEGRRVDVNGRGCTHDDALEPCVCRLVYDDELVRALGHIGTTDDLSPDVKARRLPEELLWPAEYADEFEPTRHGQRSPNLRLAEDGDFNHWAGDDDTHSARRFLAIIGSVILVGVGAALLYARFSSAEGDVDGKALW
jgi:hypothetical protein